MDGESYSACDACSRDHVRLNETYHRDDLGRYETVGTPHREVVDLACPGHRTTSFIVARNQILYAMNPPNATSYQYWGNTAVMTQCNGSGVSSDGYVLWVNIG
jgi:hypothetical protein